MLLNCFGSRELGGSDVLAFQISHSAYPLKARFFKVTTFVSYHTMTD